MTLADAIAPLLAAGGAVVVEHIPPNSVDYYLVTDLAQLGVVAARARVGSRFAVHPAASIHRGALDDTLREVVAEVLDDRGLAFAGLIDADGVHLTVESFEDIDELESQLADWLAGHPVVYGAYPLEADAIAVIAG